VKPQLVDPPQYVAYPRDPRLLKNDQIDRIESLRKGVFLAQLPLLLPPFMGGLIVRTWFQVNLINQAVAAVLTMNLCFVVAYYVSEKIADGLRLSKLEAVLIAAVPCIPHLLGLLFANDTGTSALAILVWIFVFAASVVMPRKLLVEQMKLHGVDLDWTFTPKQLGRVIEDLRIKQGSIPVGIEVNNVSE